MHAYVSRAVRPAHFRLPRQNISLSGMNLTRSMATKPTGPAAPSPKSVPAQGSQVNLGGTFSDAELEMLLNPSEETRKLASSQKRNLLAATAKKVPSPPQLPPDQQREFEQLQKEGYEKIQTLGHHPDASTDPTQASQFQGEVNPKTGEIGGPKGKEPTRYGDWEINGRVFDF